MTLRCFFGRRVEKCRTAFWIHVHHVLCWCYWQVHWSASFSKHTTHTYLITYYEDSPRLFKAEFELPSLGLEGLESGESRISDVWHSVLWFLGVRQRPVQSFLPWMFFLFLLYLEPVHLSRIAINFMCFVRFDVGFHTVWGLSKFDASFGQSCESLDHDWLFKPFHLDLATLNWGGIFYVFFFCEGSLFVFVRPLVIWSCGPVVRWSPLPWTLVLCSPRSLDLCVFCVCVSSSSISSS